jgi:hypothetical protein
MIARCTLTGAEFQIGMAYLYVYWSKRTLQFAWGWQSDS